jgi:hypothetical protein
MIEPAHGIALECMVELAERRENAVRQTAGILALGPVEKFVILAGAVLHATETDDGGHG